MHKKLTKLVSDFPHPQIGPESLSHLRDRAQVLAPLFGVVHIILPFNLDVKHVFTY